MKHVFCAFLACVCAALVAGCATLSPSPAKAAEVPDWQLYVDGPAYEQVWKAIGSHNSDLMPAEIGVLRPVIGIAVVELDGDEGPEVIAYVPDDYNLYDADHPGDPFYVFDVNHKGDLVLLAEYKAFGLRLAPTQTNLMRDLMVFHGQESRTYVLYRWSDEKKAYLPGYTAILPAEQY